MFLVYQDSLVSANGVKSTTCCSDGLGLNYTLPMFNECKEKPHPNGGMVQTIPKLIPYTDKEAACPRRKSKLGIPPGHRVCRFPDCHENTCQNGWCEETMIDFECHCPEGYEGKRCDKHGNVPSTPEFPMPQSTTEIVIPTEENVPRMPESTWSESTTDPILTTNGNVPSTPEFPMMESTTEAIISTGMTEENVPRMPESTGSESTTDPILTTE
ncbi:integumentary mucin A.1-like [Lytechinus variegatus]|uniref:integumentary mucin A.1-like n=1 Tax=Lytechinus variegatus TaxID=7654 RepID=UPI001BB2C828|nr:integumentary mucin A.1-like [Lytechinus variegatus]